MVCKTAPIPGETKIWQYITLMKRIYLIDCPGIVPPNNNDTDEDILLRGSVRVENVHNPEQYIPGILKRVQQRHLERTYDMQGYADATEFLSVLARKGGRLLRGGEPDLDGVAKMVISDFLRGKLPWFTPPPHRGETDDDKIEGRTGRLGEMRKRKRDPAEHNEVENGDTAEPNEVENGDTDHSNNADSDDEFEGLDSDSEGGIIVEEEDEEEEEEEEDKDSPSGDE
jgi:nuclear GTP-binding protein